MKLAYWFSERLSSPILSPRIALATSRWHLKWRRGVERLLALLLPCLPRRTVSSLSVVVDVDVDVVGAAVKGRRDINISGAAVGSSFSLPFDSSSSLDSCAILNFPPFVYDSASLPPLSKFAKIFFSGIEAEMGFDVKIKHERYNVSQKVEFIYV